MNRWLKSALVGLCAGISVWLVTECNMAISIPETFPLIISYALPVVLMAVLIWALSAQTLPLFLLKLAETVTVAWLLFTYFDWAWWLYPSKALHQALSGLFAEIYCIAAAVVAVLIAIPITFSRMMKEERD